MLNWYLLLAESSSVQMAAYEVKLAKMFLYIFFGILGIAFLIRAAKKTDVFNPTDMTEEEEEEAIRKAIGKTSFTEDGLKYIENMKGKKPSVSEKGVTEDLTEDLKEAFRTKYPKKEHKSYKNKKRK